MWSIAGDLDAVIFNEWAAGDDLCIIQRWIDIDAYDRAERAFLKLDWGDDEKYRYDVTKYLFDILNGLSAIDVNTIENIINPILIKEENN